MIFGFSSNHMAEKKKTTKKVAKKTTKKVAKKTTKKASKKKSEYHIIKDFIIRIIMPKFVKR